MARLKKPKKLDRESVMGWTARMAAKLTASEFTEMVTVMHLRGDFVYVNHSALVERVGKFYVVFTEHDHNHLYDAEEVRVQVGRQQR